jgi:hypothetical protein
MNQPPLPKGNPGTYYAVLAPAVDGGGFGGVEDDGSFPLGRHDGAVLVLQPEDVPELVKDDVAG